MVLETGSVIPLAPNVSPRDYKLRSVDLVFTSDHCFSNVNGDGDLTFSTDFQMYEVIVQIQKCDVK